MKIAIIHHGFVETGGAELVAIEQAKGLQRLGHEVTVFSSLVDRKRCFPDKTSRLHFRVLIANLKLPGLEYFSSLPASVMLSHLIARKLKNFDVILAHHEPGPWIAHVASRLFGIPYVCYVHHPPRFIYPRKADAELGWGLHNADRRLIFLVEGRLKIIRRLDRQAIQYANAVLVNSYTTAKEVEAIYGIRPLVCYPGIDQSILDVGKDVSAVLSKYGVRTPYVLITGRHSPDKRLEWALRIYEKVSKQTHLDLVVFGQFQHAYTEKLRSQATQLGGGHIQFIKQMSREELGALYRGAEAYAFTSANEPFGLGPIEAMGSGIPAVVWDDSAGPAEGVIDGVTGLKAKPYDLDDFARKLLVAVNDQTLRGSANSSSGSIREKFNWQTHVRFLEESLVKVANSN